MFNMNEFLEIIKGNYKYEIGIFENNFFMAYENVVNNKMTIKVQITMKELNNFLRKVEAKNIKLSVIGLGKSFHIYKVNKNNFLIIEFVVKSHIQLPKVILKDFVSTDKKLYYLDPISNEIKSSSVAVFNRRLGHYKLEFEEYLSKEYENITGKIKKILIDFLEKGIKQIDLTIYSKNMKELFSIAVYRNPNFVEMVNQKTVFSKIFYNGFTTETIILASKDMGKFDMFPEEKIFICFNKTKKGFITCKANFAEISIDNGNRACIMPLSPKIALMLVPHNYYEKVINENGMGAYMIVNEEKDILVINKLIYRYAKTLKDESVIGIKRDLEELLNNLKIKV